VNDREPPGYDDWFDEPEPPTLEQGRAGRQSYESPSVTEEDVWTLPEDESRRSRRPPRRGGSGLGGLTTTQIAIIAIAGLVILIALIAAFGGFAGDTPGTSSLSVDTHTNPLTTTTTPVTTVTITVPTKTPLQEGDTGPQVVLLQKALMSLGYLPATPPADGSFGPTTKSAVQSFQSNQGLTPDGVVGEQTLAALKQAVGG
jgi:hypothetical protein